MPRCQSKPLAITLSFLLLAGATVPFLAAQSSAVQSFARQPAAAHAAGFQEAGPTAPLPQWQIDAGGKMAFDVASVKQNKTDDTNRANRPLNNFALSPSDNLPPTGGRLTSVKVRPNVLIAFAYRLSFGEQKELKSQLPKWALAERFDIEARAPISNPTKDQFRLMVQSLLADRFKLMVHTEVRVTPVFGLELAKAGALGSQLTPHPEDTSCYTGPLPGQIPGLSVAEGQKLFANMCGELSDVPGNAPGLRHQTSRNVSMVQIADYLGVAGNLDRLVIDRTGANGRYDFSIDFVPEVSRPPSSQPAVEGPSFLDALRDQLGLKLVSMRVPLDVLVIDHIEEPSPN